ncbi:HlyD family secretion protein [Paenochrobactrum sp. BZR 588]|uniref:HlyD family secretion protein n=1 Tax=unclassified Paenochrobactrum TaxID=2639760 RepID=UPI003853826C
MTAQSSASTTTEAAEIRPFPGVTADQTKQPDHLENQKSATPTGAHVSEQKKQGAGKRIVLPVLVLAALGISGWYGYNWWIVGRFMVSTDDAYIQGDIAAIAPKVSGYIEKIPVHANQSVKAGDPVFILEDGDYRIALDETNAKLETQKQTLLRIDAQTLAAKASLKQAEAGKLSAEAVLTNAKSAMERTRQLHSTRIASNSDLDNATSALDQAQANVASAEATIAAAKANIHVLEAQYKEAESTTRSLELARDKAERDLAFTTLKAPFDGVIGNLSAKTGDLVNAGQRIAALVPVNELYIEANFKETQLSQIHGGETAHITIDALKDQTFEGTVASIAPASGAVFSLLPPENATGNFTKVVQRVPVRVTIPAEALASGNLRAGLSVVVDIDTRTSPAQ